MALARRLKEELDERLEEPTKNLLEFELNLLGKILARFNSQKGGWGMFHPEGYGYLGVPILNHRQNELSYNREFRKDWFGMQKLFSI